MFLNEDTTNVGRVLWKWQESKKAPIGNARWIREQNFLFTQNHQQGEHAICVYIYIHIYSYLNKHIHQQEASVIKHGLLHVIPHFHVSHKALFLDFHGCCDHRAALWLQRNCWTCDPRQQGPKIGPDGSLRHSSSCVYIYLYIFINNNTIYIYTVTLFKYTGFLNIRTGISYYLRGLAAWPALHIFKCCYRTYRIYIYLIIFV